MEDKVVVTLVAKLAELSSAAANSFNVSNASGAPLIRSLPSIRIVFTSITLKLASLAERSPCMTRLFKDTSVVSLIRGCLESKAVCNPLVKAIVRSSLVIVFCLELSCK